MIDLIEKVCLLATAGFISVLVPAFRQRLLGLGRPRDRLYAGLFGLVLSMWGAKLGDFWMGYDVNLRNVGILLAAVLGGLRTGLAIGLLAGGFYVFRVEISAGFPAILAAVLTGVFAGLVAERRPTEFQRYRAFPTAVGVQLLANVSTAFVLAPFGHRFPGSDAILPLLLYVALNAAGLAVMTAVARVVVLREEQARALAEARSAASMLALESLRRKLEPHFLFNSLNALRATIRTDPMLARELVLDLADLYRYLLHHPDDSTLAAEFDHARAYLRIERARLGQSRLSVDCELPDALRNHRVPALLLQPLVENAVKHGIATRKAGGSVRISAFTNERYIFIEVRDRGTGELLGAPEPGSGIALAALKESLDRRFGEEARIDLEVGDAETLARVRLPLASTDPRRES